MSLLRVGVIGYGLSGSVFHCPFLAADPRFDLRFVVTGSADRAGAAEKRHPGVTALPDAAALFGRAAELDLVVIASPNDTHVPLAAAALDHGLHVVVDKPVAVRAAQAWTLVDRARAVGRRLSVFQNRRWDGDFRTVRSLVAGGELGEVHTFESAFRWWQPEIGSKATDVTSTARGGGILFDIAPHLVDQAMVLFGPVAEVHAELDLRRPGTVADDDAFVSLRHVGGVRSRLWMSKSDPGPRPRFRVAGSRATLLSTGLDPQEAQLIAGARPGDADLGLAPAGSPDAVVTLTAGERTRTVAKERGDYREYWTALAGELLDGTPPPVEPEAAAVALEVIERAGLPAAR